MSEDWIRGLLRFLVTSHVVRYTASDLETFVTVSPCEASATSAESRKWGAASFGKMVAFRASCLISSIDGSMRRTRLSVFLTNYVNNGVSWFSLRWLLQVRMVRSRRRSLLLHPALGHRLGNQVENLIHLQHLPLLVRNCCPVAFSCFLLGEILIIVSKFFDF